MNEQYYIVEVGDEVDMLILGDNEINWTKLLFENDYDYLSFKNFFLSKYNITYKEPDYKAFREISEKYMNFGGLL